MLISAIVTAAAEGFEIVTDLEAEVLPTLTVPSDSEEGVAVSAPAAGGGFVPPGVEPSGVVGAPPSAGGLVTTRPGIDV
jgi:hypothetical protein